MKKIFFVIFSIIILFYPASNFPVCDKYSVVRNMYPKLILERGLDAPNHNSLGSKFFHNKVTFYAHEFAKCYSNFFNPKFIFQSVGIFSLVFTAYFLIKVGKYKLWVLFLLFLTPIVHIITADQKTAIAVFKLLSILGVYLLFISPQKEQIPADS